jgi:Domain of unknown function (DUF6894)
MALYYFRTRAGSSASDAPFEFADRDKVWTEMTNVCGDLIRDASRNLTENTEWNLELLDETKKPMFRIRLVAETMR